MLFGELFQKLFRLNNSNNSSTNSNDVDIESNTASNQPEIEHSVPFKWRGSAEDAIFQASLATTKTQLKSLKTSIYKTFLLNVTFPMVLSFVIIAIICFASTAMQLVGIIILFFCLIFCTDLVMVS
jgi:hypothetical protein